MVPNEYHLFSGDQHTVTKFGFTSSISDPSKLAESESNTGTSNQKIGGACTNTAHWLHLKLGTFTTNCSYSQNKACPAHRRLALLAPSYFHNQQPQQLRLRWDLTGTLQTGSTRAQLLLQSLQHLRSGLTCTLQTCSTQAQLLSKLIATTTETQGIELDPDAHKNIY